MTTRHATCAGCARSIYWRFTPAGKRMPLDVDSVPPAVGTYVITGEHHCRPSEPLLDPPETMHHMNHWASCEDAALFRRSPAGKGRAQ